MRITKKLTKLVAAFSVAMISLSAAAVTVTFDGVANGVTSFSYDADADLAPDALFSKLGGSQFSFSGPGPNVLYVSEPGLTAAAVNGDDVRVDFPNGAITSVGFGFARSIPCVAVGSPATSEPALLRVFDASNTLLGTASVVPECTVTTAPSGFSSFVEAEISVNFSGTAAYALVDFQGSSAYILDNFIGTFGSIEVGAVLPTITSVLPASGSTVGGTSVVITGTNFTGATAVTFGGNAATSFTVDSNSQITAVTPPGVAGAVSVSVTTPSGSASTGTFTYTQVAAAIASIPTLSEWAMIIMASLMALFTISRIHKKG